LDFNPKFLFLLTLRPEGFFSEVAILFLTKPRHFGFNPKFLFLSLTLSLLLRKKKKFLGVAGFEPARLEEELVTRYLPDCATPRRAERGR